MTTPDMKQISVFDNKLTFSIPLDEWEFFCKNELFSDTPSQEDVETEFVTGTGITPKKQHLWAEASTRFVEYIKDLRRIKGLDINKMCRDLTNNERKQNNGQQRTNDP